MNKKDKIEARKDIFALFFLKILYLFIYMYILVRVG
jgi:hypothetical protein